MELPNKSSKVDSPSLLNFVRGWISVLTLNGINGKLIVAVIGSLDSTLVAGNGNDSCDKLCEVWI